ncbi:MAG: sensor histidine kinase [Acidothermaceae bacterium]
MTTLPAHDIAELVGISAASSAAVTAVGLVALKAVRRRPLRVGALVVALTPVLTVVVAAAVATIAMFISTEQFGVVIAIVAFAGCGGVITSVVLARSIMQGSAALRAAANALSRGEPYVAPSGTPSAELDALARELEIAHARLEEAHRRERAVDESRRELIAWVSHDLRTPLAGIRAMTEALEDGVVSTDADRSMYHQRIRVEVDRLARMVDDLFELSRIHAGALNLSPERLDLADVVRDAVASAGPVARAKGVTLTASDLMPAAVDVDPHALSRVVGNLLSNAVRHTRESGSVTVSLDADRRTAFLTVADECGGIAESELERVFDVAYRGISARTPMPDGGAGLGLAIARGIIAAHRGTIAVENAGPGCRFTVTLPRTADPDRSADDIPPERGVAAERAVT